MLKTRREFPSIGLILAGSGNPDSVRCVSPDYTAEGKDALNNLPNGVWLTNLDFAAANLVRERSGTGILHADGWFGMDWKDLREEWRFPSELSSSESSRLAQAIERSVHLSLNVGLNFTGPDTIGKHEIAGIVSHSGGLANGLAKMLRGRLAETVPKVAILKAAVKDLHQFGFTQNQNRAKLRPGTLDLRVQFPRVGYALSIAKKPVPAKGKWRRIIIPDSERELSPGLISAMKDFGLPVLLSGPAKRRSFNVPSWVRGWCSGKESIYGRNCFTLEEAELLLSHCKIQPREAFIGPGWRCHWRNTVLGGCITQLGKASRSMRIARSSWSVGRAAESFIKAACLRPPGRSAAPSLEAAWLAAHDRISMNGAIELIESFGGAVLKSEAGSIEFQIENAPGKLELAASALWRKGLTFPMGQVADLSEAGIRIPIDPMAFGGSRLDRRLACAVHSRSRKSIYEMDEMAFSNLRGRDASSATWNESISGWL